MIRLRAGPATGRDLCDALNCFPWDLSMLLARLRRKGEVIIVPEDKAVQHLHGAPPGTRVYATREWGLKWLSPG